MRKVICSLLIILLLFNFVFCNSSYAEDPTGDQDTKLTNSLTGEAQYSDNAQMDNINGENGTTNSSAGNSAVGMVVGLLARIINVLIALQIDLLLGTLSQNEIVDGVDKKLEFWFTIDRVAFNRVALFDINFFDTYEKANGEPGTYVIGAVGSKDGVEVEASIGNIVIKKGVARIYYVCRIIALILALIVLIYIGIRMALSTVASDRARYKKMLISWVESMIILFAMLYLTSFIIYAGRKLTDVFYSIRVDLLKDGEEVFEDRVRNETWDKVFSCSGLELATWSLIYWCMLILQVKFFFNYARRFLMTGLLIMVSPLITITYSIDKAGDGKAQAFGNWMKEFILCVLIQPLHALVYLIFAFTANEIASRSPLVALALMLAMTQVERMVRVVFRIQNSEIVRETHLLKKGGGK